MSTLSGFRSKGTLVSAGVMLLLAAFLATPAAAQGYLKLNLVSRTPGRAIRADANLTVPWGLVAPPGGPWWISNEGSATSTLYDGFGKIIPLVVSIPAAPALNGMGKPTGIAFNGTSDFVVSNGTNSGAAIFVFATLDGTISGWSPQVSFTHAILAFDNSSTGAVYTGLAIGTNSNGNNFLYATNFSNRTIDMLDAKFKLVASFTDPGLLPGFTPFGIQNINGKLYVTFAPQSLQSGLGNGYVDVFDTDGGLISRFTSFGPLNLPWGLVLTPINFGHFSEDLLIGNLGDGLISAFQPDTGEFLGQLADRNGSPIAIPALWGLSFGNDGLAGKFNVLYFTAGGGLFGAIYPRGTKFQ